MATITPIWQATMQRSRKGDWLCNVANVAEVLRSDPDFSDLFWFDQMRRRVVVSPTDDTPVDDGKLKLLQEELQLRGFKRVSTETIDTATYNVAQEHLFHPLKQKLEAVTWDGERRLWRWTHDYLGTDQDDYHDTIGTCALISVIARIYHPGCKVDYMPVLEGPQGEEKSKIIRALAVGYYSDAMPALDDDPIRVSQHLNGKLIIEIADLSSIGRAETTQLKAFVTRQEEIYTPKYGRHEVHEPRQCVLWGTTNKAVYLKDETGGRRFWPLKCGRLNVAGLERIVWQLYAEARKLYGTGTGRAPDVPWWPDRDFELAQIKPVQDERFEQDVWAEAIAEYKSPLFDRVANSPYLTIKHIAEEVLKLRVSVVGTADQRRIVSCLEFLGHRKGKKQAFGIPWYPPPPP